MKKIFSELIYLPEFQRDLEKLQRRFRSLSDDLERFIKIELNQHHKLNISSPWIVRVPGLSITHPKVYKARRFACTFLKGTGSRSGIRVIYSYFQDKDRIEFIEIYYKGDKKNEDKERIKKYCRNLKQ